jgi:hypothetical protein
MDYNNNIKATAAATRDDDDGGFCRVKNAAPSPVTLAKGVAAAIEENREHIPGLQRFTLYAEGPEMKSFFLVAHEDSDVLESFVKEESRRLKKRCGATLRVAVAPQPLWLTVYVSR